jgi:acetoin utilization deacetylase AcuC-like enzyme
MPWGTQWDYYEKCLDQGLERIHNFSPDALVISLGVDIFENDPISKFKLKSDQFLDIGSKIAKKICCPSLFVMEGGYAVDEIGVNVVNLLAGFLDG